MKTRLMTAMSFALGVISTSVSAAEPPTDIRPVQAEVIARLPNSVGNMAFTPDNQIIFSQHPFYSPDVRVAKLTSPTTFEPFPNAEWNTPRDGTDHYLDNVLGLRSDENGVVWIIDMGFRTHITPKLVGWNTRTNKLERIYYMPEPVTRAGSQPQDIVIDQKNRKFYIADEDIGPGGDGSHAAIIVIDIDSGYARRLLDGDHATMPENVPITSDALKLRLRSQPLIHGDETTVQVLKEKDKKATSTSYMWAYRSGKGSHEPIVLLDYQPGRGQIHPQAFLGDYRGIVMSDGYTAWRTLERATHIGCMAHSRRRFVDALRARKKGGGPPEQALRFFDQIYRVERQARDGIPEKGETQADCIRRFRQQHSVPILNALKVWLDDMAPKVLPDSKLGDAVSYTRNQWQYLTRYTGDGSMPIDNNLLERDIRVFATGRKSWLFSDTVDGAKASAVVYSLMLTCRASRVEPLAWLRHVLTELPQRAGDADITDLLPFNFHKAATA